MEDAPEGLHVHQVGGGGWAGRRLSIVLMESGAVQRVWSHVWGWDRPWRAVSLTHVILLYRWINWGRSCEVTDSSPHSLFCFVFVSTAISSHKSSTETSRQGPWVWDLVMTHHKVTRLLCYRLSFPSLTHFRNWQNQIYFLTVQPQEAIREIVCYWSTK
jgi:hypothetical protein